jgi:hypothetical protein
LIYQGKPQSLGLTFLAQDKFINLSNNRVGRLKD